MGTIDQACCAYFGEEFLSKFNPLKVLGVPGSYEAVYQCSKDDGKDYAVKVVDITHHRTLMYDRKGDEHLAQLETEIIAMRSVLGHPHNVQLDSCYLNSDGSCIILVMEFATGWTPPQRDEPGYRPGRGEHCTDLYDVAVESDWFQNGPEQSKEQRAKVEQRRKRTAAELVSAIWFCHSRAPSIIHRCAKLPCQIRSCLILFIRQGSEDRECVGGQKW